MKILFLLTQDLESPYGVGRFLPMARELKRLGYEVGVAALHANYEGLQARHFDQEGVDVHYVAPMHVRKQGNLKTYYSSVGLLRVATRSTWHLSHAALSSDADIIHIGKPHPMSSIAGLAAKTIRRHKVFLDCDDFEAAVGHFHSGWEKRIVAFFEDRMPRGADHVTTNTYFTLNRMVGLGVPPERITYISNGVDRHRFASPDAAMVEDLRARLGLHGKKVVAFVGSLSLPSHPVDLLFKAFQRVHEQVAESSLLLVGGGDDYPRLQEKAHQMRLGEAVVFTGRIAPDQVALYYHLADVSVDPVLDDGAARGRCPLKLFESWACMVPFVSCDVGDRRILLGDPLAGLLARPGDPESLAEHILSILNDPNLASTLRRSGLQRVEAYYWDVLVKNLDRVYRQALEAS